MTDLQHRTAPPEELTAVRTSPGVAVRAYRPADHNACRRLWGELTEHLGALYGEPVAADPGAGFEEYLTQLDLSGMWVADSPDGVVGFVGLMLDGRAGAVDPVVVEKAMRRRGIGRALLLKVADEAKRRGLSRVTVAPSVRDVAALRALHSAGFDTVASVTLSSAAASRSRGRTGSLDLHDLKFSV